MARYTFGQALDDDDVLVIQGQEYKMQPIGMRVMKNILRLRKQLRERVGADGKIDDDNALNEENLDMALQVITEAVRPSERDRLAAHIEDSVGPRLLAQIAGAVMSSMSDLDPTQPGSSSDGSAPDETGSASTDGAPVAASTPSI